MKHLCLLIVIFIFSCKQENNSPVKNEVVHIDSVSQPKKTIDAKIVALQDKTVKFLWREKKYDEKLKTSFHSIFINEEFCETITEPERAALGYVATFIGNECNWDGAYKEDRSNLKCKILTALNLGYQCSDKHLGFLRQMFKNDRKVLEEIKSDNCPTTPDGATSQDTFEEITLTVKGNEILVFFKASGVNLRASESWTWTETDHFLVDNNIIKLIKKDKSKINRKNFETEE